MCIALNIYNIIQQQKTTYFSSLVSENQEYESGHRLTETGHQKFFSELQILCFGEPFPMIASDYCSWLTGV